jgi:peptidyl-prolyl cis-trans isomerase B (cyclophilin B)
MRLRELAAAALSGLMLWPLLFADATAAGQASPARPKAPAVRTPGSGPVIVVETVKGKRGFYNGQRVHRAVPNFVVQFGDPQSRDMTRREWWGRGDMAGSGTPVGAAEISKKHLHIRGAVAMAHSGNPANADAQFYVVLAPAPKLNGKYAVFGKVVEGVDVPAKLKVADMIRKVTVRTTPSP